MSTILENGVAPLWVWILVIALSSAFIILIVAFLSYRCVSRRRRRSKTDVEANGVPTRRLTVRDGKVVPNQNTSPSTISTSGLLDSTNTQEQEYQGPYTLWSKEKPSMGSPSTTDSPDATPSAIRYSSAPRLSLGSLDDKEPLTTFSSVSDLSVVSKPQTAAINELKKSKAINFSRPQSRNQDQPSSTATRKNRLSVINESTPRNSFISRIVSWASNNYDNESKKSGSAEKISQVDLRLPEPQAGFSKTPSPLLDALEELQRLAEAPTPELPSKHPSRQTSTSDITLPVGSRSSSINEARYKHSHKRSDSGTNFSRRGTYTTHSRSSSVTNYSRRPHVTSTHSRESSNTSMFEEPQATLSGPFDALAAMGNRESCTSTLSNDTEQVTTRQRELQPIQTASNAAVDADTSTFNTDPPFSGRASVTPSTYSQTDNRPRSRSRSRSRGPGRTTNKSGRAVLRKRSLQSPDITMLGPVDPAALENLSVMDSQMR